MHGTQLLGHQLVLGSVRNSHHLLPMVSLVTNLHRNTVLSQLKLLLKSRRSGRESAIQKALAAAGLEVTAIRDVTQCHESCPPKRRRRV